MVANDYRRIILISISPPENDCGCRIVLYRHLEERKAFDYIVATREKWIVKRKPDVTLKLPYFLHRLEKSRFGPALGKWLRDYENLIWPFTKKPELEQAIISFRPDAILNLADPSLSPIALRAARRHKLPLIGMFNDWFPIMPAHFGHRWTCNLLSRRYREFYKQCDLAFCTSEGMQRELGPHPNSHVLYPMPGSHQIPENPWPPKSGKFRIVYVGAAEGFYGRMLCSLIQALDDHAQIEIKVVTPNNDWPKDTYERARKKGIYLGFMPPPEAARVLAGADALLVLMSFEKEHELFMRTSFTTKFLDYVAFSKPIIFWGPDYCSPSHIIRTYGGAVHVKDQSVVRILEAVHQLQKDTNIRNGLITEAQRLRNNTFNPEKIQSIFTTQVTHLIDNWNRHGKS